MHDVIGSMGLLHCWGYTDYERERSSLLDMGSRPGIRLVLSVLNMDREATNRQLKYFGTACAG